MSATVIGDYGVGPATSSSLLVSLVSSWKMADVNDALGTNNLTNVNSVSFASAGKIGNCGTFTAASNMYLYHADGTTVQVGDEDFSFACWVKFNNLSTGVEYIIAKADGNPGDCFKFVRSSTIIRWTVGTSSEAAIDNGTAGYSTGVWISFVMIHDSVNNVIQLWADDGAIQATSGAISYTGGAPDDDARFTIGALDGGYGAPNWFVDGAIDNVNFWRKVLSSAERTEWFNGGAGKEYPF